MNLKKTITFFLIIIMIFLSFSTYISSSNDYNETIIEQSETQSKYYGKWEPLPLLVLLISFDANGNGVDDYDPANSTKLFGDKTSPYYGEQWITSKHDAWANRMFYSSNSLSSFFKKMTNESFYFLPARETHADSTKGGKVNDGVVEVVVKLKHPYAQTGNQSNEYSEARIQALKEASKYVNFKQYDKDNNNVITDNELAIMYICAGTEYSSVSSPNGINARLHFSVHAHYTKGNGTTINGLTVGNGGFVRIGEFVTGAEIATIGVCAHELCHFLGAPDLYDTVGSTNYCGNLSLMASGSWLRYNSVKGMGPAYLDAPLMVYLGFSDYTEINEDGTYTLFNRDAKQQYNIFKINTPDPYEYYLIENRYVSEDSIYDVKGEKNKGIFIWHVDEKIATSGYSVNSSSDSKGTFSHDPGIVPMGINGLSPSNCGFVKSSDGYSDIFTCKNPKYKFPVSETCFTRLNINDTKDFNFTIKVLSDGNNEMKIQVNFYSTMPVYISSIASEITISSVKLDGKVVTYNDKNANKTSFILSKNSNPTPENGIETICTMDKDGNFNCEYTDLEPNTKYFYKAIVEGPDGTSTRTNYFYTDIIKKERTEYYVVYMYKGITDVERSYEVKVKPGQPLSYKFPMNKLGYTFCGWYLDPEYKEKYDMSFTQTECKDFNLYGKWVENYNVATITLIDASSVSQLFAYEVGDLIDEITPQEIAGKTFIGWYSDPELTQEYDFTKPIDASGEIKIYAKWANDGVEETTNKDLETTELETTANLETTNITNTTNETLESTQNEQTKTKSNTALIIVIVVIAVLIIFAVVIIVIKKKKNEDI